MKIGQTSIIFYTSKLLGSLLGFVATLYFARKLGAEVLGVYALVMTVVGWLLLISELGIGQALTKRISEGSEEGAFLSAAIVWITALSVIFASSVVILKPLFERYIGEFSQYVSISVVWFIIGVLFVHLFFKMLYRILKGQRLVHIAGLLTPVQIGGQSVIQIALVLAGTGLLGMLVGYALGGIIVGLIGLYWVSIRPTLPSKRHFRSLFNYAKFSWLGSLKSRTFNEVDILLLGVFVQSSLVGVYSVAWSISKFLELFGSAISETMFPEISHTSVQKSKEATKGLIEDSLAFTGLIAIPGLVGGGILANHILRIYGQEFVDGSTVLALLILATLLYSYLQQLMNGLNGINRPDLSFRINVVFIGLNAGLNIVLIPQLGIEGAAVASVVSVAITLAIAHRVLKQLIVFRIPRGEILRQVAAALVMGGVVFLFLGVIETLGVLQHNFALVVLLVVVGSGVYFTILFFLSPRLRETVERNLPTDLLSLG